MKDIVAKIVRQHGCEVLPGAFGRPVIQVRSFDRCGDQRDVELVRQALAALQAAGVDTAGWLS